MSLIEKLASALKKSEAEVLIFLKNAPKKYKVYTIPKRTSGHRVIAQPSKELKEYQRKYLELQDFPIHNSAIAYRKNFSIKDNANAHKKNRYLLKLDLENFFNSISNHLFWRVWESILPMPPEADKRILENLLFWCPSKTIGGRLILSIGAPSSPLISNFFMYKFDDAIYEICMEREIKYTRYADDLTFSTNRKNILFELPHLVETLLFSLFGSAIRINKKKTKFSSTGHNRHVTGITISNNQKLSLGRDRKRYIKHLVHHYMLEKLSNEDTQHLRGLLSFAKHVEPLFLHSLENKYSTGLIHKIVEGRDD
ncbi:retron St85 family RNA-directed DNA polymerase [Phytopseudomonas punonensis]|uniref:RNA-directed DNA polymerase n=1 Tax=Phytopseudomonas punonensis TaxID=1220495 RepID=A0A1M7D637_9GAMM|nr:retron St85 family RNA-directed DNA polymerase [Pseudomonas punonensis]SHL74843.1 Retron-type reverse transcriptase [Pseudomonas punonensis]